MARSGSLALPRLFVKDEEAGSGDHHEPGNVIPLEPLSQIENRKDGENGQADDLLDRLQLGG